MFNILIDPFLLWFLPLYVVKAAYFWAFLDIVNRRIHICKAVLVVSTCNLFFGSFHEREKSWCNGVFVQV